MSVTGQLAERIVAAVPQDLPSDVNQVVREILLDGLSNMIAGAAEPFAKIVVEHVRELGGPQQATVVGHDFKSHVLHAAFANGVFCHALDFEMVSYPPTHPTSPTLAPLLAIGEFHHLDAQQFSMALVVAFEVTGALRTARPATRGIHPPGSVGTMGAAAGCAKALGLDVDQTRAALGIAGSRVAGLMANTGTMTKSTHSGHAARMGLESAMLAQRGMTANLDILDAKDGFNDIVYDGEGDLEACLDILNDQYWMLTPGLAVKKYPAQYTTHWAIDAALEIQAGSWVDPLTIRSVKIEVGSNHSSADRPLPKTGLEGKFSLQYTVAAAILDQAVGISTFRDERLNMADMQLLLPKVHIVKRRTIDSADFNLARTSVTIVTSAGQVSRAEVTQPLGIWNRPLSWEARVQKLFQCAEGVLDDGSSAAILNAVENFSSCQDVGRVLGLLGGSRNAR